MSVTNVSLQNLSLIRNTHRKVLVSYFLMGTLALTCGVLFLVHAGKLLNLGFPVLAALVSGLLFRLHRNAYIAFTLWIWLFTPEIRRLVDYQSAYHNVSPVMITPLLVTSFTFFTIFHRPRFLLNRSMLPFGLFASATLFAFVVGVFKNGFLPAAFDFGSILSPLGFGIFLIMDRQQSKRARESIVFASLTGLIIVGAYGLYQFYNFPPWDAFWLDQSRFSSAGSAFAGQVRIFGTLNSPGPYGFVLMAFLVFVMTSRGGIRIPAAALGFPALVLCGVRAAWGGFTIGALLVIWRLGGKARLRFIILILVACTIAEPFVTSGIFVSVVSNRFSSLSNIKQDSSYQARYMLYQNFAEAAFSEPIGTGLGRLGVTAKLSVGQTVDFDSGILKIPFEFGWVAGLLIFCSIFLMIQKMWEIISSSQEYTIIGAAAIFFSVLSTIIFGPVFEGINGMLLWTAFGLALSARINDNK